MQRGTVMIEDQEDERRKLNRSEPQVNRGVELLLRNRRRKPDPPKTFQVKFGKMVSLFRREIVFHLNFYLDIRKK
tara:strand:- start:1880 stop:2104 length:225 start_codon:yes stop_codon:yes gene_type:complete